MEYIKQFHDNVRHAVRSITIYTPETLDHFLSVITYEMMDNLTDYNNDPEINKLLDELLTINEEEDEVEPEFYDMLFDEYYESIIERLRKILETRGRINGGDYDILKIEEDKQ